MGRNHRNQLFCPLFICARTEEGQRKSICPVIITTFSSLDSTGRLLYRLLVSMRILAGTRKQLKKNVHKHAHTYVHTPVCTAITASLRKEMI